MMDKRERARLFRERLTAALQASGMSRAALARAAGVDRSTISQVLQGEDARMPGSHLVAACAQALAVSADWLLGLTERPEQAGALLAATLSISETGRATSADDQIYAWHEEAAGYKIRHVPATLPDMLKTTELMEWEYAPSIHRTPGQAIAAAEARLDWMRSTLSDYEIAMPVHELTSLATGKGYYEGLAAGVRAAQLDWLIEVHEQLYPTLRLHLYDARHVWSAPVTIFGPKIAAIYIGRYYVAFRGRDRVQALTRHFDWLVREARVSDRNVPAALADLRSRVG